MKLLPLTGGAAKGLFTKSATKAAEPKGNKRPTDPQDRRRLRGEVRGRARPPKVTVLIPYSSCLCIDFLFGLAPTCVALEVLIRSLRLALVLNAF